MVRRRTATGESFFFAARRHRRRWHHQLLTNVYPRTLLHYARLASDQGVVLAYSSNGGLHWHLLQVLDARFEGFKSVPIPPGARTRSTRFMFWQPYHKGRFRNVWLLDDVHIGQHLGLRAVEDAFQPLSPSNFLFLRGAAVETNYCNRNSPALVARDGMAVSHEITTRDLFLVAEEVVVFPNFDPAAEVGLAKTLWSTAGASPGSACGLPSPGWVFAIAGPSVTARYAQTLAVNTSKGNLTLSFYFGFGSGGCDGPETSVMQDEDVYVECSVDGWKTSFTLMRLGDEAAHRAGVKTAVALDDHPECKAEATSFRWRQASFTAAASGASDAWVLSEVHIRGAPPAPFMAQFDVAMGCMNPAAPITGNMILQMSKNAGVDWENVVDSCQPDDDTCTLWREPAVFTGARNPDWQRVTIDLGMSPGPHVRFRFHQDDATEQFAIDKLYIGPACPALCNGHGYCAVS